MTARKRPNLKIEKRKVTGRKVKQLRKQGILPASIYGKKIDSLSVKTSLKEVGDILGEVGETGLVDLQVEKEEKIRTVLLKNPQYNPITDELIHIDFHQVDLSEKVTVAVPVETVGEAPAIETSEGVLIQLLSEIEIEALPTDLPEKFVINISKLENIGETITVADLKIDKKKISLKVAENQVLVKVELPTKVEEEEEKLPVEESEAAEVPGVEVKEGEAPKEKKKAKEGKKENGETKTRQEPKGKNKQEQTNGT